ncbi:hypothetical protein GCM10010191_39770 [Actinomadura vinacea]|uniref:Uncharacterized protein n=1 Tax=Actinomadura vinacea TaxID=115336 RepID=A0ABP5WDK1_9ACTN
MIAAALTGLGLGLLALGPGLAPGFVLSYDMVFVPDPGFTRMTFGLTGTVPRHVPSDAAVTALATVLPAWAAQRLVLLGIFVMACTAAASLVPSRRMVPRLAAGVCYAWNPFVAERLLLGQWALLLGYAALPWVLIAASRADERGGGRRLVCALLPAAIGGFAALAVSGMAALLMGTWRGRGKVLVALAVLSLPWLVPGALRPGGVPGDGPAVEAFAARADTPFGTLGSVLLLGGVWNGETVPTGYGAPVTAALWGAVVVGALFAYWRFRERIAPWWRGAAIAAGTGYAVACLGAVAPALLEGAIGVWSGLAVFRDGQQFAAPLAVVVAVGLGLAADEAIGARYSAVAFGALAAPVVVLPSLAWGAAGQLRSVDYPADWARAKRIIESDPVSGDVLVLPWAAYRGYAWNHGRRVLDPLPRYLHRRVVVNDAVTVGPTTVAPEDPKAARLDGAIRAGGPLTGVLGEAGVRYVAVDARDPAAGPDRLPGAQRLVQGPDLVLYRIPVARDGQDEHVPVGPVIAAWIVVSVVVSWSSVISATTLGSPLLSSIPRRTPRRRVS